MRLRPRYSLMTLLLLTALVAGGVKLWYGPHHVVEQTTPSSELEYTYARDLRGNRIKQGVWISRTYESGKLNSVFIDYFREDNDCNWTYSCRTAPAGFVQEQVEMKWRDVPLPPPSFTFNKIGQTTLSPEECREFQAAIDAERQRIADAGLSCINEYEGMNIFKFFQGVGR